MPGTCNPDIRRIRVSTTYSVAEIADLLDVHVNTVGRWLKSGLTQIDGSKPILVHGSELRRFLKQRRRNRKRSCAPDEFPCFRCRAPRKPVPGSVEVARRNPANLRLRGICTVCGTAMWKAGSLKKLPDYVATFGIREAGKPRLEGGDVPPVHGDFEKDELDA